VILTNNPVLYKFKPEATPEQRQSVRNSVKALPSQIPSIQNLIIGETVFNHLGHGYDEGALLLVSCHRSWAVNKDRASGVVFLFENLDKLNEYRPHKAYTDCQAPSAPYIEGWSSLHLAKIT
jgi:hypothetical protein